MHIAFNSLCAVIGQGSTCCWTPIGWAAPALLAPPLLVASGKCCHCPGKSDPRWVKMLDADMFGNLQHVVWFNNMWGKNMPTWEKEMAPWPWSEKGVVEVVSMMAWDGAGLAWLRTGPGIARASWNMPPIFWNITIFTQSILSIKGSI